MILLNLGIVRERLHMKPELVCGELFHEMQFRNFRPMPLAEHSEYSSSTLYMTDWLSLAGQTDAPHYLICIGGGEAASAYFAAHGISGLIYADGTDHIGLFTEVQDIFDRLQSLHTEYRSMLIAQHAMHDIINAAAAFFDCFSVLLDASFNTLEYCSNYLPEAQNGMPGTTADTQHLIRLLTASIRRHQQESSGSAIQPQIDFVPQENDTPAYYLAHFSDGNCRVAMFAVCASPNCLRSDAETLFRYVVNLMSPCIMGRFTPPVKAFSHIRSAISSIIENASFNYSTLSDSLSKVGWNLHDTYQLVYVRIQVGSARNLYTVTDYYRYEALFPDCIAARTRAYVVVLVHNSSRHVMEQAMDSLRQLMKDFRMECIVSLPFNDFMQLREHFGIVSSAINMGESKDNVTLYRDVMAKHIVSEMNMTMPVKSLCHLSAVRIFEYDRENGTELLLSLEKYLRHNQSLQEAAEEMFIHRNTLNYRLKTCMKIADLPLDTPDERIHLFFSCIALRCLAGQPQQPTKSPEKPSV